MQNRNVQFCGDMFDDRKCSAPKIYHDNVITRISATHLLLYITDGQINNPVSKTHNNNETTWPFIHRRESSLWKILMRSVIAHSISKIANECKR